MSHRLRNWVISEVRSVVCSMALLGAGLWSIDAETSDYELEPILYSKTAAKDEVLKLQKQLQDQPDLYDSSSETKFVERVLEVLDIPKESQVLVFSKTSLQVDHITPARPRALFFSDRFYLGWVQGGDLELISVDPDIGPVFYRVSYRRNPTYGAPEFHRSNDCLRCHASSRTEDVPGMLVRSVFPDQEGMPIYSAGTYLTEPSSPLEERWGGWYVTGSHEGERHMGNRVYKGNDQGDAVLSHDMGVGLSTLEGVIQVEPYPMPTSDIVALLVMEHQIKVHNLLTQASFKTRQMIHMYRQLARELGEDPDRIGGSADRVIEHQVGKLLSAMVFEDEIGLAGHGVDGGEAFQRAFLQQATRDSEGRSLRDFQLLNRIFKYRLSYMIYSPSFESLPQEFKKRFYARLWKGLTEDTGEPSMRHLSASEKSRILQILLETKPEALTYWRESLLRK